MEKTVITEEMKVHEKRYEEAENTPLETLPDFIKPLPRITRMTAVKMKNEIIKKVTVC